MDNLAARILNLVSRLAGREELRPDPPAASGQAATETAYRQALQRWFELTAQGPAADRAEVDRVHQDLLRLIDDVGQPRATSLCRQWANEWREATGLCPWCGQAGPYHDPALGARDP